MIVPDVGSTSRLIIFSVVVLPQPDGPTRATTSPSAMSSERSPTAARADPSKRLWTSTREIAVVPLATLISGNLALGWSAAVSDRGQRVHHGAPALGIALVRGVERQALDHVAVAA